MSCLSKTSCSKNSRKRLIIERVGKSRAYSESVTGLEKLGCYEKEASSKEVVPFSSPPSSRPSCENNAGDFERGIQLTKGREKVLEAKVLVELG